MTGLPQQQQHLILPPPLFLLLLGLAVLWLCLLLFPVVLFLLGQRPGKSAQGFKVRLWCGGVLTWRCGGGSSSIHQPLSEEMHALDPVHDADELERVLRRRSLGREESWRRQRLHFPSSQLPGSHYQGAAVAVTPVYNAAKTATFASPVQGRAYPIPGQGHVVANSGSSPGSGRPVLPVPGVALAGNSG